MNKNIVLFVLFYLLISDYQIFSQNIEKYNSNTHFTVLFYNVENLYDTVLSETKGDSQFLPDSKKQWTGDKYLKKTDNIARVISSVNQEENPEIIGLCEVENLNVLKDLSTNKRLEKSSYKIIHKESQDLRGIDVALLYREDEFKYISHQFIPLSFPFDQKSKVRDILYVKGVVNNYDTLHVFVNHWKSRSGGNKETEPKRVFSAMILKNYTDSIIKTNLRAKIIAMGDFNDEPTNKSLNVLLEANNKRHNFSDFELYNLMYDMHNFNNQGTYFYDGNWNMLDNIIVSHNLLYDNIGFHTSYDGAKIFNPDWLTIFDEKKKQKIPFSTYDDNTYTGGFSDHFAVYMTLIKE